MTVNVYPHHSWSEIRSFREQLIRPALQQQRLVPWDAIHVETMGESREKPCEEPEKHWENYGKTIENYGKPWENHGKL